MSCDILLTKLKKGTKGKSILLHQSGFGVIASTCLVFFANTLGGCSYLDIFMTYLNPSKEVLLSLH